MKKFLQKTIFVLLWLYLFFCTFLFINQKSMIYFPNNQDFEKCEWFQDYKRINYNWTRFFLKEKWKDIIVDYHWNAWSVCYKENIINLFETLNYSILIVEYAWYTWEVK